MTDAVERQRYSVLPEIPDTNTLDIATYGSQYLKIMSILYVTDELIDQLQHEYNTKVAGCYGKTFDEVRQIFKRKPMVVGQEKPRIESVEEIAYIQKAKDIYQVKSALEMLKKWRAQAEIYGAMKGAQEYGQKLIEEGMSNSVFAYAQKQRASHGMTNDYASVRDTLAGIRFDPRTDEQRNIDDMNESIAYANEIARMEAEYPEMEYEDEEELYEDEEDGKEEEISEVLSEEYIPDEPIPIEDLEAILSELEYEEDEEDVPVSVAEDDEDEVGSAEEIARIKPYESSLQDAMETVVALFDVDVEVLPPDTDDVWINPAIPVIDSGDAEILVLTNGPEMDTPLLEGPLDFAALHEDAIPEGESTQVEGSETPFDIEDEENLGNDVEPLDIELEESVEEEELSDTLDGDVEEYEEPLDMDDVEPLDIEDEENLGNGNEESEEEGEE